MLQICGIEAPENMPRCINNCYNLESFWKNWHASYNKWLVRCDFPFSSFSWTPASFYDLFFCFFVSLPTLLFLFYLLFFFLSFFHSQINPILGTYIFLLGDRKGSYSTFGLYSHLLLYGMI